MTDGAGRVVEIPASELIDASEEFAVATETVDGRAVGSLEGAPVRRRLPRRSPLASIREPVSSFASCCGSCGRLARRS